jgi:hypothetical protein
MATSAPEKVKVNAKLVKTLTLAVKKHLLDNGGEPALINDEVIRSALTDYNASIGKPQ